MSRHLRASASCEERLQHDYLAKKVDPAIVTTQPSDPHNFCMEYHSSRAPTSSNEATRLRAENVALKEQVRFLLADKATRETVLSETGLREVEAVLTAEDNAPPPAPPPGLPPSPPRTSREEKYSPPTTTVEPAPLTTNTSEGNFKAGSTPASGARPASAVGTFLRIATVNDVYTLDNYPHLASAVAEARACESFLDCKVVSTLNGDFLSPCVLSSLDGGRAMAQGLSLANVDFVCLGNHELDLGLDGLAGRLGELKTAGTTCVNSNFVGMQGQEVGDQLGPPFVTLKVGERLVVLGGFLTDDQSIYAPSHKPTINPVDDSIVSTWEAAVNHLRAEGSLEPRQLPALFLPMTHQLLSQDVATGEALSQHHELSSRTPVLLGGHDHEACVGDAGSSSCCVVKVGQNGERLGFVDVWWTSQGLLQSSVSLVPATLFPREPKAAVFASEQAQSLRSFMGTPLAPLPFEGVSTTARVRFEESEVASWLLSAVKQGLQGEHRKPQVAMLQGGGVRGNKTYPPGHVFAVGDLFTEFAFDLHFAVVDLPGAVLLESVANSRSGPKPAPHFLHLDGGCAVSSEAEGHQLLRVDGQPFNPHAVYTVALYQFLLHGLNAVEPLFSYAQANLGQVPGLEACRPAKELVLEAFASKTPGASF